MTDDQRESFVKLIRAAHRHIEEAVELCHKLPEDERKLWITRFGKILGSVYFEAIVPLREEDPELFPELRGSKI